MSRLPILHSLPSQSVHRNRNRHQRQPQTQPAVSEGEAAAKPANEGKRERPDGGRRDSERRERNQDFRKRREQQAKPAVDAKVTERTEGAGRQPFRGKPQGQGQGRGKFQGKPEGRQSNPGKWSSEPQASKRDRPADPNSPFAKLAALKEQLASKDQR